MSNQLGIPDLIMNYFYSGYTLFNTIIYSIILIIILFGILKLFEKLEINPSEIIVSLIPLILLGSSTRALVDHGILPYNILLITPGIYIIVGIIGIASLLFGYYLCRKKEINYKYTIFLIGLIFAIIPLSMIEGLKINILGEILGIWFILTLVFVIVGKYWKLYRDKINLSIISAHLLDATTTFIGVDYYNYTEQHVLPEQIYNISETALTMYPLKIIVITIAIYLIEKYIDDETLKGLLKLVIFVLGLAPGIRNMLTIIIS
ncbi:DUF63 family protein [Methanobrevibacter sp. OttesenSCG-928-I08]|nr:DUF63 family protein [Methanobrevibacter sp. OttesenSCG-928-I08]